MGNHEAHTRFHSRGILTTSGKLISRSTLSNKFNKERVVDLCLSFYLSAKGNEGFVIIIIIIILF